MSLQTGGDVQPAAQQQHVAFAALISSEYDYARPRRREIRQATVLAVEANHVFVDLGAKRDGLVPSRDLDLLSDEYRSSLRIGREVPVYVMDNSETHDEIIVSLNKGLAQKDWLRAQELAKSEEICECTVTNVNRGGVVVKFSRLRGFVPNSHLTSISRGLHGERLRQAKSDLVGKTLSLTVIEVDSRRQRLVLSERQARRWQRQRLWDELTEGEVRTGTVRNLVNFGAFVDLGGVDGLIHISELDWKHVRHPRDVVRVGDSVEVYVLRVDRERQRIGLSRKRLLPDPWLAVADALTHGDVVDGEVTNVVDFGAFVDLGDGVEGLVHVSEMPDGEQTKNSLSSGDSVRIQVLSVDPRQRRISLSMRVFAEALHLSSEQINW